MDASVFNTARFASDEMQQLLTIQKDSDAKKEYTMQPYHFEAGEDKEKPMRRFVASSATSFITMRVIGADLMTSYRQGGRK